MLKCLRIDVTAVSGRSSAMLSYQKGYNKTEWTDADRESWKQRREKKQNYLSSSMHNDHVIVGLAHVDVLGPFHMCNNVRCHMLHTSSLCLSLLLSVCPSRC